jgi:hypothetical protein
MRQSLVDLFKNTIVLKYHLTNTSLGIDKCIYTNVKNDFCYENTDDNKLVEIIYNSIVDYAFNEKDFNDEDINDLHFEAIDQRVRIEEEDSDETKEKYGIFGETLLNMFLVNYFGTNAIIAKGYFYDILKPEENKGYDSFHLVEEQDYTNLWFGEVKFYQDYKGALNSIFKNIEKAISDNYFIKNLKALTPKKNDIDTRSVTIIEIIKRLRKKPDINIIELVNGFNLKLIYPICVICQIDSDYDNTIREIIDHIKTKLSGKNLTIGINYELFLILLPINNVKQVKQEVVKWINSKAQLTLL